MFRDAVDEQAGSVRSDFLRPWETLDLGSPEL